MGIFADYAPRHFDAGLNVMPVRGKRAFLPGWSKYCNDPVSDDERAFWLSQYPDFNIGLPLGPANNLVAVDIDVDDPKIISLLEKILPYSPWRRVGKKGFVQLYRYNGEKTFRVRLQSDNGEPQSLMDFISTGGQVVLPPSIHPETLNPYTANAELVDVIDQIGSLPPHFEDLVHDQLRSNGIKLMAKKSDGGGKKPITTFISAGSRDNELVRNAGLFALDVIKGTLTLKQAVDNIETWAANFTEKVWGDELPEGKGTEKLIEFLRKDIFGPKRRTLPQGWNDGLTEDQLEQLGMADIEVENRRLSYDEINELIAALAENGDLGAQSPKLMSSVALICTKIGSNAEITGTEQDVLLKRTCEATSKVVSIASMRKQVIEIRKGPIEGSDHTELAQAVLDEMQQNGVVRHTEGAFWQWAGAFWRRIEDETEITKMIAQGYGHYPAGKRAADHTGILKIMRSLCSGRLVQTEKTGVNFVNGFLTEDLELLPHDPDFGSRYILPYPYLPETAGKCTKFMALLTQIWGDDPDFGDKVASLQQAIALTFFQRAWEFHKVFLFLGPTRSGKSTLMDIISNLFPSVALCDVPPKDWSDKYKPAQMLGTLMNCAREFNEKERINEAMFKSLVTGEPVPLEMKFQDPFSARVKCAHWFASNHPPKSSDKSGAFAARWLIFKFNKRIPDDEIVPNFADSILEEEREAIVAWAVQGLETVSKFGYRIPPSSKEIVEQIQREENPIRFFLASLKEQGKVRLGAGNHPSEIEYDWTSINRLRSVFRQFSLQNDIAVRVNSQEFLRYMADLQHEFGFEIVLKVGQSGFTMERRLKYLTLVGETEQSKS